MTDDEWVPVQGWVPDGGSQAAARPAPVVDSTPDHEQVPGPHSTPDPSVLAGPAPGLVTGVDGLARCWWSAEPEDYRVYHDQEWGRVVHGEAALYERLTLEAFQSGLSWLTILRKRDAFREAFAGFDPELVAAFGPEDEQRLLEDARIVRNRPKISAAITNARAVLSLRDEPEGGLDALVWSFAPDPEHRPRPRVPADIRSVSAESTALAKALKRHGFVFVGPTTVYAAMQACGVVNDHLEGCHSAGS